MLYSNSILNSARCDFRRESTLTVSSQNSQLDSFLNDPFVSFRSSGSGNIFKEATRGSMSTSTRPVLPYVTHYSDSGFGSALSAGSSCSYLPPPPPYRLRTKQRKIHRSFSDSKYSPSQQPPIPPTMEIQRQIRGVSWNSQTSLSPSPSMSTVSCPEYPELQEKLYRLAMARDSLSLQVSVLSEQVGAQKEKIRDLEALLALKRNSLTSTEELLQDKYHRVGDCSELESKKMDLLAEVSSLKLKFATLEREKNETEKKLRMSQSEMDHVSQSMHGMVVQQQLYSQMNGHERSSYMPALREHRNEKHNQEMEKLRHAVQRLMADNEQKNIQITNLKNALDEQERSRSQQDDLYPAPRWEKDHSYDLNTQIRRLLLEEPSEPMTHSSSFPVSLCSSTMPSNIRNTVQSSSSYTSSLSAASPQHSWSQEGTPRHLLHPTRTVLRNDALSYRSPSSPAARQLAAELDELRRIGTEIHSNQSYSSASLPRGMGNKASSTLTLPAKKLSIASGASAGELTNNTSVFEMVPQQSYRAQMNRWISEKLRRNKRATSAPNLVESDDEITRGHNSAGASQSSVKEVKPLRRDRTRSSLRNLFSKLTRSTSQDQNGLAFRRGSAARSTSSARLGYSGSISGAVALHPPLAQFVEWKSDQLAEWMAESGFAQYVPEVSKNARNGRHLLNMSMEEFDSVLGIKNPLHRKRLNLSLRRIEDGTTESASKWDVHHTQRWLEDIGLPQYKDIFAENMINGSMLLKLTASDLVEMKITNAHHYLCIARSIQYLKMTDFKQGSLEKRFDEAIINLYPCPEAVVRWSHSATCEWLKKIDLAEFCPNLLCAGTTGALMVYEPTFTSETLAEILQMPPHKTLLRRHLTTHFNQLVGQKIVSEKRDYLASGVHPQLIPGMRIKIVKKGFSLTRKKAKNEICLEPEELLCPSSINHKYPSNGDNSSLESSNV